MKPLSQNGATDLGYKLLKDSPLSEEARGYVESSLPYIIQKFYLAGYCVAEPDTETKTEWKTGLTKGEPLRTATLPSARDIQKMKEEGVIY